MYLKHKLESIYNKQMCHEFVHLCAPHAYLRSLVHEADIQPIFTCFTMEGVYQDCRTIREAATLTAAAIWHRSLKACTSMPTRQAYEQ